MQQEVGVYVQTAAILLNSIEAWEADHVCLEPVYPRVDLTDTGLRDIWLVLFLLFWGITAALRAHLSSPFTRAYKCVGNMDEHG